MLSSKRGKKVGSTKTQRMSRSYGLFTQKENEAKAKIFFVCHFFFDLFYCYLNFSDFAPAFARCKWVLSDMWLQLSVFSNIDEHQFFHYLENTSIDKYKSLMSECFHKIL